MSNILLRKRGKPFALSSEKNGSADSEVALPISRQKELKSNKRSVWVLLCYCMFALIAVSLTVHRTIRYYVNNSDLIPAITAEIERSCPPPNYYTLGQELRDQPNSATLKKPKICMTTLTDAAKADFWQSLLRLRNFGDILNLTMPNKESYCKKYGYHLFDSSSVLDNSRPPSWSKNRAARRLLVEEKCDWVFWIDADTVIMNSEKRIEDFLPASNYTDVDYVVTPQKGDSWNAGAWLIRNSAWSLHFLDTWWNMTEFVQPKGLAHSGDNTALKAYLKDRMPQEEFNTHIVVPPRCQFNSVAKFHTPWEANHTYTRDTIHLYKKLYLHPEIYHKGDFVAHIAGISNKIKTAEKLLERAV